MHEAKNDNVLCTSQEDGSACLPQKRLAHGLRFIECKVTDLFLHFQKNLSFSNEGKERTLAQIHQAPIYTTEYQHFAITKLNLSLICQSVNLSRCQGGGFL